MVLKSRVSTNSIQIRTEAQLLLLREEWFREVTSSAKVVRGPSRSHNNYTVFSGTTI